MIRDGHSPGLSRYFTDIQPHELLSREEEVRLARRAEAGHLEARDELVRANLGFVVKVAKNYRNLGVPFEELINEGNLGLIEAARRFDPAKGTKFITCAVWWIRKAILAAVSEKSRLVRLPHYQRRRVQAMRDARRTLRASLGREPRREEVSRRMAQQPAMLDRIKQLETIELSTDWSRDPRDAPLIERLTQPAHTCPERRLIAREREALVDDAVSRLSDRERKVITGRFGLSGEAPQALKDIGEEMGISRERVRQIESQALKRLRRMLSVRRRPLAGLTAALPSRGGSWQSPAAS